MYYQTAELSTFAITAVSHADTTVPLVDSQTMWPTASSLWLTIVLLALFIVSALHIQTLSIVRSFPHDPLSFTEGLCFAPVSSSSSQDGPLLLESSGIWRSSSLRTVELHTSRALRELRLTQGEFGEGIAVVNVAGEERVVQLTYQNSTAYQYQLSAMLNASSTFFKSAVDAQVGTYTYPSFVHEGWGLTSWPGSDSGELYMSNGSNTIHVLHASNISYIRSLPICVSGTDGQSTEEQSVSSPLSFKELELLSPDALLANLYPTRCLAVINLTSSQLLSIIQADDGSERMYRSPFPALEVMNVIAYLPSNDSTDGMLLVTGKRWPTLYQVRITERSRDIQDGPHVGVQQSVQQSEEEQLREACPAPAWTPAEALHANEVVSAMQEHWK